MKHGYTTKIPKSLIDVDQMDNLTRDYIQRSNDALLLAYSVRCTLANCETMLRNAEEQEDQNFAGMSCEESLERLSGELEIMNEDMLHILHGKNPGALALGMFRGGEGPLAINEKVSESIAMLRLTADKQNIFSALIEKSEMGITEVWPLIRKPSDRAIRECLVHVNGVFMGSAEEGAYFLCVTGESMSIADEIAFAYALVDGSIPSNLGTPMPDEYVKAAQSEGFEAAQKFFFPY